MSSNDEGKYKLPSRTITGKYEIFEKKLTKEKRALQSHGNIDFQDRRCVDGLKENLRLMMK